MKSKKCKEPKSRCCDAPIKTGLGIGALPFCCSKCDKTLDLDESQNFIKFHYDKAQNIEPKGKCKECGNRSYDGYELCPHCIMLKANQKPPPKQIEPMPKDWEKETIERIVIDYANLSGRESANRAEFRERVKLHIHSLLHQQQEATIEIVQQEIAKSDKYTIAPLQRIMNNLN